MHLLLSIVISLIVAIAAILSVQNAGPITVTFLVWQSIRLPEGLVLGFGFCVGLLTVAVAQPLWQLTAPPPPRKSTFDPAEFDEEDWN